MLTLKSVVNEILNENGIFSFSVFFSIIALNRPGFDRTQLRMLYCYTPSSVDTCGLRQKELPVIAKFPIFLFFFVCHFCCR